MEFITPHSYLCEGRRRPSRPPRSPYYFLLIAGAGTAVVLALGDTSPWEGVGRQGGSGWVCVGCRESEHSNQEARNGVGQAEAAASAHAHLRVCSAGDDERDCLR
jgi:hypothetical protein